MGLRVGFGAIGQLIGHYTFGRYVGVIENQTGPIWYYVPVVILGFFPWIAFVPVAVAAALQDARRPRGAFARLAIVWAAVPFLFFSFASTKLPNYVALMLPALAILVALWFQRVRAGDDRHAAVISAASIPVFVGLSRSRSASSRAATGSTSTSPPSMPISSCSASRCLPARC